MEYLPAENSLSHGKILCCKCGVAVEPNPANMCVACLRTEVDITEGIPKQGSLYYCRSCDRYLQPPNQWITCALESRELLALCLKKLKGLNKVRLVDAGFVWTEPHSKRIKVKLTIQKEVFSGTILQQIFIIEFTVNFQMCDGCHRHEAKDFWRALVQVRQKTEHKKTFFYLEQLILKHKAHQNCLNVKARHDGLDFYFAKKDEGRKMVDFFQTVVPCRYQTAQQLISHDIHSNIFNYKHTFSVEIIPVCKDDIVCLSVTTANAMGNIGQLCICTRVTNSVHLIDPLTLQVTEINSEKYWRNPFNSICSRRQYTEFVVMDIDRVYENERNNFAGQGPLSQKHELADVWVVPASQLGISDEHKHCKTHLGHLLKPGDWVLGFDMANANINDANYEKLKPERIPDVILIKKVYGDKALRSRKRKWKLKRLAADMDTDTSSVNRDYNDFLDDLEEDAVFRQNVNVYVDKQKMAVDTDDMEDDGGYPQITLQEMLDEMNLSDVNDEI